MTSPLILQSYWLSRFIAVCACHGESKIEFSQLLPDIKPLRDQEKANGLREAAEEVVQKVLDIEV